MLYQTSASLFPRYAIPRLRRRHGRKWSKLVKRISYLPVEHPEHMAFTLMMRRIDKQVHTGSEALCMMPGCATCASDVLEQFGGNERTLMGLYKETLNEVRGFVIGVERAAARAA